MIRLLVDVAARHLLARRRQSIVSLLGVVLGLFAAGLPALRAGRLQVTQSLAYVN